ncbi:hypothetical protein [Microvirus mar31]|uniref:Uncharacterized protein n=1 Tax=Microvirus mar31 TaxID=2851165 RepID=A0A8F5RBS5_9VIRU|nr:hypothetical protein [Microvirus mar31]
MRIKRNDRTPRSDRRYFREVANRTSRLNTPSSVPRGGIRL